MKVQFAPGRLRIRVSRADFDALARGGDLEIGLPTAASPWRLRVAAGDAAGLRRVESRLAVTLPHDALRSLAIRLPSRDGVQFEAELDGHPVDVRFEVDLRDGHAPR